MMKTMWTNRGSGTYAGVLARLAGIQYNGDPNVCTSLLVLTPWPERLTGYDVERAREALAECK